jgi:hypothetical protein
LRSNKLHLVIAWRAEIVIVSSGWMRVTEVIVVKWIESWTFKYWEHCKISLCKDTVTYVAEPLLIEMKLILKIRLCSGTSRLFRNKSFVVGRGRYPRRSTLFQEKYVIPGEVRYSGKSHEFQEETNSGISDLSRNSPDCSLDRHYQE